MVGVSFIKKFFTSLLFFSSFFCFEVLARVQDSEQPLQNDLLSEDQVLMHYPEGKKVGEIIRELAIKLNKNVIMDKDVSAVVHVIAPSPLPKKDAWELLLTILTSQKLAVIEAGPVLKVVSNAEAMKSIPKVVSEKSNVPNVDKILSYVYKPKYSSMKEVRKVLSKVMDFSSIKELPGSNSFVLLTTGLKLKRIIKLLEVIDSKKDAANLEFVQLRHIDGDYALKLLSQIVKEQLKERNKSAASKKGLARTKYFVVPGNQIALWGREGERRLIKSYLKKFDIRTDSGPSLAGAAYVVYPLQFIDATKFSATISAVIQKSVAKNRFSNTQDDDAFVISADSDTNSIVVRGSRVRQRLIQNLIRSLDKKRNVVLFDIQILETTANYAYRSAGSVIAPTGGAVNTIASWEGGALSPITANNLSPQNQNATEGNVNAVVNALGQDLTIATIQGDGVDVAGLGKVAPSILISLLKADTNSTEVSSPKLVTVENELAEFSVGQTIYFKVTKENSNGGQTVEWQKENVDFAVGLKPGRIQNDYISLDVDIDSNQVSGLGPDGLPKTAKRRIKNDVILKQGQTLFIGGLDSHNQDINIKKIPFLADLPILGPLFMWRQKVTRTNKLMLFITAYLIHSDSNLNSISDKYISEKNSNFGIH